MAKVERPSGGRDSKREPVWIKTADTKQHKIEIALRVIAAFTLSGHQVFVSKSCGFFSDKHGPARRNSFM